MTINYNGLKDKEQEGIAFFVSKGYKNGVIDGLHWDFSLDSSISEDEFGGILELIERGFTSGYYPNWNINFKRPIESVRLIENKILEYMDENEITLSDEKFYDAVRGVRFWLDTALPEAISDSVSFTKDVEKS